MTTTHPQPPVQPSTGAGTRSAPTDRWLATVPAMPPLTGAAGTAERLLLLVHYGIDWTDGWVGRHRTTYWDKLLPDRVIAATYRAGTLRRWWRDVAHELQSQPRSAPERLELERLLRDPPGPILEVLRLETEALLLRVRITADAVRAERATHRTPINPATGTDAGAGTADEGTPR